MCASGFPFHVHVCKSLPIPRFTFNICPIIVLPDFVKVLFIRVVIFVWASSIAVVFYLLRFNSCLCTVCGILMFVYGNIGAIYDSNIHL